jgi:hypothetical protein
MAAQRAVRRFVMVMPAGNAAHLEARVAFGFGKPCYAVDPVAKAETLYRFFDRMFTSSDNSASWLASPLVTPGDGRPRGARSRELPT